MMQKRQIDHIVYAVPDLEKAMEAIEKKLGLAPLFGGYHTNKGTKNALLNLGNACYLELLAIDESNTNIAPPRWMGIDLITTSKITRWSIKSNQLAQDSVILKNYHAEMGNIEGGQRKMTNGKMLSWQMTMPLAEPAVEVVPFMTNWEKSNVHPTDNLPDVCKLLDISFVHPQAIQLQAIFDQLHLNIAIQQGKQAAITIRVESPNGIVTI